MDWIQSVNSYIRVVEEGSFNAAARKLNTTSSAISKRIQWLEDKIGVQLLKRTTRSISQTEAGALFYERAKVQLDSCSPYSTKPVPLTNLLPGSSKLALRWPSDLSSWCIT